MNDIIEIPEDVLYDTLVTHRLKVAEARLPGALSMVDAPFARVLTREGERLALSCEGCEWPGGTKDDFTKHVVEAIKEAATAAENERLEHSPRDSRRY